jgi:hypothetical protein
MEHDAKVELSYTPYTSLWLCEAFAMLGHLVHNHELDERPISHPPILPQWMRRALAVLFRRHSPQR